MKFFKYILTSLFLLYSVTSVAQTTQEVTQGTEVNYHITTASGSIAIYIWSVDNEKDVVVLAPDSGFTKLWDEKYPVNSSHTLQVVGQSPTYCNTAPKQMTVYIKGDSSTFSVNGSWSDIGSNVCPSPHLALQVNLTKVPEGEWSIKYEINGTTYYAKEGKAGNKSLQFNVEGSIPELSSNGAKTILLRGIYIEKSSGKTQIVYNDKNAPKLNFSISRPEISNIKF